MEIFIDTNIFISERYFVSSFVTSFFKACKLLRIKIFVPELVIDEVKGNYYLELRKRYQLLEKSVKNINKLLVDKKLDISIIDEKDKYNNWLDSFLQDYEVQRLPYPDITLQDIVVASYNEKKPFKSNREGHKDYIIWKTILKKIENSTEDKSYFLTNNTSDFCERKGQNEFFLHKELLADLSNPNKSILISPSLRELFDKIIKPSLDNISSEDILELSNLNLEEIVEEIIGKELNSYSTYGFEGLPFNDDVTITFVNESNIKNLTYSGLGEEILITAKGNASIDAEGFVEKTTFRTEDNDKKHFDFRILEINWNDSVALVGANLTTPYELSIIYSKTDKKITSHELYLLEEISDF